METARVLTEQDDGEKQEDLEELRKGNVVLFERLVRRHHRALIAAARPLVGDDAEEVVQNAWIKIHKSLPRFEGRSRLRTWLTRIVINEAKMALRRRGRELSLDSMTGDRSDPLEWRFGNRGQWVLPPRFWEADSPQEIVGSEELLAGIQRLLERMPANQRAMLEMRDVAGMDFDEICNILEISSSNARVLLHRARGRLHEMVDRYQESGRC